MENEEGKNIKLISSLFKNLMPLSQKQYYEADAQFNSTNYGLVKLEELVMAIKRPAL